MRPYIKTLLLCVGITISWATLMLPVKQVGHNEYADTTRGLACVCVFFFMRVVGWCKLKCVVTCF